jgi:chemotaxis protein MotB
LTLANDIWFDSGRAEITPVMRETATEIAHLLAQTFNKEKPFEIVVAGHTDNVPINTVRYPSNWHLSKDRAVNFLEVLISESKLDPYYFYARACGQERPIASNDTVEGRQRNRRVEVMISLAQEDPVWWDDLAKAHVQA